MSPTLTIEGMIYGGWTALQAQVGIEQMAGRWRVELTERWPQGGAGPAVVLPIRPGVLAALSLAGQVVQTGYIDTVERSLGPTDRTVTVAGRDKSAELVDCSATVKQYSGQTLLQIAQDQCAAFGVEAAMACGGEPGEPFNQVAVEPGESVHELLDRLARQRGLLLRPDGAGGLLIGAADCGERIATPLVAGGNLLGIRTLADWSGRYSEYIVRGQSAGSDDWYGADAAEGEARATDDQVAASRHRPLILMAEDAEQSLQQRADWEQRVRYGRALQVLAGVQGWEAAPGVLWRPGYRCQVVAPTVAVDEDLLIVAVTYTLDRAGTRADLTLTRPEAYAPETAAPETPAAGEAGGWWA